MSGMKLTVLLPCFNEEKGIKGVIEEIKKVLSSYPAPYEILVVDDGSTDNSRQLALDCGVRVESHGQRRGSGAARKTGIRKAGGEIIATLDADGSYDPSALPQMLKLIESCDQVNGQRTAEQGCFKPLRRMVKGFIRCLVRMIGRVNIADLNTGFKVFRKTDMLPYLERIPDGFSCVTTMTMLYLADGKRMKFLPVAYRPRKGASKFHPFKDTWAFYKTAIKTALLVRKTNPFPM